MSARFERSWVAVSYLLGLRGQQLHDGLGASADHHSAATQRLLEGLSDPDRKRRAEALAGALRPLIIELERQELH